MARVGEVAGNDQARLADPVFRAFAEWVWLAVLDPRCANLPLPQTLLGRPEQGANARRDPGDA